MRLHEPVRNFKPALYPNGDITQWFGQNVALYSNICAAPGVCLTKGHNGIDIVRPWGEPIFAVEDGLVVETKESSQGYGKHVRIVSPTNREWTYGHLSQIGVTPGQTVTRGAEIGKMGNTGFVVSGSTPFWSYNPYAGTHLHLGYRQLRRVYGLEPTSLIYLSGTPQEYRCVVENYGNGFLGSLPLTAADFRTEPTQQGPDKDLTIQSLLNYATQLEAQGNSKQAGIVRAVAGIVRAFTS